MLQLTAKQALLCVNLLSLFAAGFSWSIVIYADLDGRLDCFQSMSCGKEGEHRQCCVSWCAGGWQPPGQALLVGCNL